MPSQNIYYWDDPNNWYANVKDIVIPSGTYVQLIPGNYKTQRDKKYRVKSWRGISKEDKKTIKAGIVLSYDQVKGNI